MESSKTKVALAAMVAAAMNPLLISNYIRQAGKSIAGMLYAGSRQTPQRRRHLTKKGPGRKGCNHRVDRTDPSRYCIKAGKIRNKRKLIG